MTTDAAVSPQPLVDMIGKRLLLAEDDYVVASDMARSFTRMGGTILGPFATIAAVMRCLDTQT